MPLSNILTSATQKGEKVLFFDWEVSYVSRYKNTLLNFLMSPSVQARFKQA